MAFSPTCYIANTISIFPKSLWLNIYIAKNFADYKNLQWFPKLNPLTQHLRSSRFHHSCRHYFTWKWYQNRKWIKSFAKIRHFSSTRLIYFQGVFLLLFMKIFDYSIGWNRIWLRPLPPSLQHIYLYPTLPLPSHFSFSEPHSLIFFSFSIKINPSLHVTSLKKLFTLDSAHPWPSA